MQPETAPVAYFGHHPDPSTDLCIEVEALEGWAFDAAAGLRSQWPFWGRLSRLLRFIRSGQADAFDEIAQRARPFAEGLEARFRQLQEERHHAA